MTFIYDPFMMPTLFCRDSKIFRRNRWNTRTRHVFSKENLLPRIDGPEHDPQDPVSDWHPADVLAALKKRGFSLVKLSTDNGYHPTAAGKALKRPWPAMEKIIATAIGVDAETIWPSRYKGDRPASTARTKTEQ